MLERGEDVFSFLVMEDGMMLGEGVMFNILVRNVDVFVFCDKSIES